MWLFYLNIIF